MAEVSACPDVARYQQLAAGQLPPDAKESLLRHLEGCDACAKRVDAFSDNDTLVELIRRASLSRAALSADSPVATMMFV